MPLVLARHYSKHKNKLLCNRDLTKLVWIFFSLNILLLNYYNFALLWKNNPLMLCYCISVLLSSKVSLIHKAFSLKISVPRPKKKAIFPSKNEKRPSFIIFDGAKPCYLCATNQVMFQKENRKSMSVWR